MDRYEAIKLNALWSVWNSRRKNPKEDEDYELDRMIRWYAKTFNVSIDAAQAIPTDRLLEVYWLEMYEEMEDEKLEAAREKAVMDPEALKELQRQEDEAEWDTFELAKEMIEEQKQDSALSKLEAATNALKDLTKNKPLFAPKESELVMSKKPDPAPDIKLEFVDGELDEDQDPLAFGLMEPPKK